MDREEILNDQKPVLDIKRLDYQPTESFNDSRIFAEIERKSYENLKNHVQPIISLSYKTSPQSKHWREQHMMNKTMVGLSKRLKTTI